jgi:diadenosine tetraphosphate (Ap4A) HIT family hydrolase
MDKKCQFCLENNNIEGDILYETDLWYYVTSIDPILCDGGMIITKRHITEPFALSPEEWSALQDVILNVQKILDQKSPDGYNLGWNIRPVGGQNVEHAHLHFFSRYEDEPLAYKGMRYAFKQDTNKRKSHTS